MGKGMDWDKVRRGKQFQREEPRRARPVRSAPCIRARYNGTACAVCHQPIFKNELMQGYFDGWAHKRCAGR